MLASELQLRDKVITYGNEGHHPHTTSTVVKIEKECIHLVRPFTVCQDFSYTGGVMWSLGVEQFIIWPSTEVTLLERPNDTTPLR